MRARGVLAGHELLVRVSSSVELTSTSSPTVITNTEDAYESRRCLRVVRAGVIDA